MSFFVNWWPKEKSIYGGNRRLPGQQHKEEPINFTTKFTALGMGKWEPEGSTEPVWSPPRGVVTGPRLCESEDLQLQGGG